VNAKDYIINPYKDKYEKRYFLLKVNLMNSNKLPKSIPITIDSLIKSIFLYLNYATLPMSNIYNAKTYFGKTK